MILRTLFLSLLAAVTLQADRPNLVLIIADDMAWNDCGAYGNTRIKTPHLDQLAKDGMRFDAAFLTTSSCSPSRCSIITGRYPHNTDAEELHMPLPGEQITFVEDLKANGYWTGAAGKWHLGNETLPKFDKVHQGGGPSGCENWIPLLKERAQDKPFFLWLASSDPHRGYKANAIPEPHTADQVIVPPFLPDVKETRTDLALYYDEISRLDSFVGNVVAELKTQGVSDNTLVLFISDNGRPFPRSKTTVYDSGIKTPWILSWPAKVEAGSVCKELVSVVDIAPTFLKLGGVEPGASFQGVDFAPLLSKPNKSIRKNIFGEHNWHDFDDHQRAVRNKRYKYIRTYYTDLPGTPPADAVKSITYQKMLKMESAGLLTEDKRYSFIMPRAKEELYDLEQDPYELRNLAKKPTQLHKTIIRNMRAELNAWERSTKDTHAKERTPDGFDRITGNRLKNNNRTSGAKKKK